MTKNIETCLNGAAQGRSDDKINRLFFETLTRVLRLPMAELGQTRIKMARILTRGFVMGIESRLAMPDEQNLGHVGSLLIEFDMI